MGYACAGSDSAHTNAFVLTCYELTAGPESPQEILFLPPRWELLFAKANLRRKFALRRLISQERSAAHRTVQLRGRDRERS